MEYQMVVESDRQGGRINALELAEFLQKFRAAYVVALSFVEYELSSDVSSFELQDNFYKLDESFRRFLRASRNISTITALSKQHLPSEMELEFLHISSNSPLKFIGYCTGISLLALSLAASLAGGEVDLRKMTFKVQPLAEAVAQISRELRRP